MGVGLVDALESIYALDGPDDAWLERVLTSVQPTLDEGLGVAAYCYDARGPTFRAFGTITRGGMPLEPSDFEGMLAMVTPEYVEQSWARLPCGTASMIPGWEHEPGAAVLRSRNAADLLCINGFDPSGVGVCIAAALANERRCLPSGIRARWTRLARHLASGFRLRHRVEGDKQTTDVTRAADAVFSPNGRLAHGKNDEVVDAERQLREAVRTIEKLRTKRERRNGDAAVAKWRVRVDARWSLVDAFESDGRRYVVALSNDCPRRGLDALTPREEHVLAYAALEHSNKLIAYELGLAHSTVRVLLARAMRKLGVKSRDEAVAFYRAHRRKPLPPK
jgi:DNA-binding CsgD family transcriptional regulator